MLHRSSETPLQPLLLRAREVAILLGVSESQVGIWSRAGDQQMLHPVRIPGIRAVRFRRDEVETLARQWCESQSVA